MRTSKERINGGRKVRKEEMADLQRDNSQLRELLEMQRTQTLETWNMIPTQDLRDRIAADALFKEWFRHDLALRRLGFTINSAKEVREIAPIIFDTPGCRAICERDLTDAEARRPQLLQRQVQIAIYGEDDASVRAFGQLAKLFGWQKTPDVTIDRRTLNLYNFMQGDDPKALSQAQAVSGFVEHEPGKPIRIDVGADAPGIEEALADIGDE